MKIEKLLIVKPISWGFVIFFILVLPHTRYVLEASMPGQMVIQIPALILSGFLIGKWLEEKGWELFQKINYNGVPGILLSLLISFFWMLPRMLDGAVDNPWIEILKFVTVPMLIGVPVAWSWNKLQLVGKGFILSNLASMYFVMGWLYKAVDVRICNNYLLSEQRFVGNLLMYASVILFLLLIVMAFKGPSHIEDGAFK